MHMISVSLWAFRCE